MALQSIKLDLHLSDAELGFVGGLAFFAFYAAFGVPMGRWADSGDRVKILSFTRVLWGGFVMLTGRATSFLELLLFRMGAGIGESGCLPPAYSLISDYFSRQERPEALGIFFMAAPAASIFAYFGSGWLIQFYGWRVMFAILGLTGFIAAPIAWMSIVEPRRQRDERRIGRRVERASKSRETAHQASAPGNAIPLMESFRLLYGNKTYRNLVIVFVINYTFTTGLMQWQPAFFLRSYSMTVGVLGTWLAIVYGVTGVIGTYFGGRLASNWAGENERLQLLSVAVVNCVPGVLFPIVYLTHSEYMAFALLGLSSMSFGLISAPLFASLQGVVPSSLRGMSIMFVFFFANMIGSGLGPVVVGMLSEILRPMFGVESLRYALLALSPWFFWSGWFGWRASRSVADDVEKVKHHGVRLFKGSALRWAVSYEP